MGIGGRVPQLVLFSGQSKMMSVGLCLMAQRTRFSPTEMGEFWEVAVLSRLSSVAPRPATGWRRAQGWSDWASPKNDGKGNGNSQMWQWTSHVWRFGAVGMSMARLDTWVRGYTIMSVTRSRFWILTFPKFQSARYKTHQHLFFSMFFFLFF